MESAESKRLPTILVVEDDPGVNRLIGKTLGRAGYTTITALTGAEALAEARNIQNGIVLLDYQLPDMDGKQVIAALDHAAIKLPIIMITGHGDERIAIEIMKLGVSDYVIKEPGFVDKLPKIILQTITAVAAEKELVRTQQALVQVTKNWQATFNAISDFVILMKPDHEIVEVNNAVMNALGKTREEIIGKKCYNLIHMTDAAIPLCPCDKSAATKEICTGEYTQNGQTWELIAWPIYDENNRITSLTHIVKNITDRKRAEDQIRSTKAFLNTVINAIADPVFVKDENRKFELVNDALCAIVGRSREQLVGEDGDEMFPVDQVEVFKKMDYSVLETGIENVNEESLSNLATGEIRTIVTRKTCFIDPAGKKHLVGVIRDMTERNRAARALQESETRFRAIAENSHNAIGIINEQARFLWFNDRMMEISWYTREQVMQAESFMVFLAPESVDFVSNNFMKFLTGQPYEHHYTFNFLRSDGSTRTAEKYMTDFIDKDGKRNLIIHMLDITDRIQAEEKVRSQLVELQRWQDVMVGREGRVQEIKREVNELCRRLDEPARYPSQEKDVPPPSEERPDK